MSELTKKDLQRTEKDLETVIAVHVDALDNIIRTCTKDGMVRVLLAGAAYPDKPKYTLTTEEELQSYSLLQDIQDAHFKLFAVKGALQQMED